MYGSDQHVSSEWEELLAQRTSETPDPAFSECVPVIRPSYKIMQIQSSSTSRVFIAWLKNADELIVIKILPPNSDPRYFTSTRLERQRVQLDAFYRNKEITPDVYLGVAPIYDIKLSCEDTDMEVKLGDVIKYPTTDDLKPSYEYALLMNCLPSDRQLDRLLKTSSGYLAQHLNVRVKHYLRLLTQRVAYMHLSFKPRSPSIGDWGSCEQLKRKLNDNIKFAGLLLAQAPKYKDAITSVRDTLVHSLSVYQPYFDLRIQKQYIKYCHGDLKSQNIWILSEGSSCNRNPWERVKILDALYLNSEYTNIDILSDFAMLVTDVQAETHSLEMVEEMVKYYLELTEQDDDEITRTVLTYYLVEKALVRSVISRVKECSPARCDTFMEIAAMYESRLRQSFMRIHA